MSSRLYAFNSGSSIPGASQSGNLSVSNDSIGGGSTQWWNGPNEDLGYVIGYPDTTGLRKSNGVLIGGDAVGFMRTSVKTNEEFLSLANSLTGQNFVTPSVAANWLNTNGYYTSYSINSDLGTLTNPGISAQAIYDSGQTLDGWYYIKTSNMTSPRQVYCNMTDEGGGWMLISYSPDNTRPSTLGIPYPNQWIAGDGSFSLKLSIDVREIWYNNGTAQCDRVMKMASPTGSLEPLLTNMQIANQVVYSNPNNLQLSATFSTSSDAVIVNNTPMSGTWSGIKGHTLMVGPLNVNAPGDWIYQANQLWWTVCGPSSAYPDTQGRSGNAQGSGSWTNVSSENIYGMLDVSSTTTSQRNDIRTYAVYIK
jgi:hypothetical protein